MNTNTRAIAYA